MSIPIQRPSQKQVFDYDFWAVFLGIVAMFFFFLTLVLAKSPTHTSGLDVFAGRGLRISSVSALVTALVALFRFRHSCVLAILRLAERKFFALRTRAGRRLMEPECDGGGTVGRQATGEGLTV